MSVSGDDDDRPHRSARVARVARLVVTLVSLALVAGTSIGCYSVPAGKAETAHVHGEVSDVANDVARLRREIEALKRSMATSTREARGPRDGQKAGRAPRTTRTPRKVAPKKR